MTLAPPGATRAQDETIPGVVVSIGDADGPAAAAAARDAGGATWSLERLRASPRVASRPPDDAVANLRDAYLAADFLRCLSATQAPELDVGALLAGAHRESVAAVTVFGAACALGAGDPEQAIRALRRAYAAELDVGDALAVTSPEVQTLAEEVRLALAARSRVDVAIATRPPGADVSVDGGGTTCAPTPCRVSLRPGVHNVAVTRLGYRPRHAVEVVDEDRQIVLALDPAPAALARTQLAAALAGGMAPDDVSFARAAADAFEARVVAISRGSVDRAHAAVFDRARDRVLARVAASGDNATASSIRAAILEWRGLTEPTPLHQEPLLWVLVGAGVLVAAAVGVLAYVLTRPPERRYDLVFFVR